VSASSQRRQTVCVFEPYGCEAHLCYAEIGSQKRAYMHVVLDTMLCRVFCTVLIRTSCSTLCCGRHQFVSVAVELLLFVCPSLRMSEFRISVRPRRLPRVVFCALNFAAFNDWIWISDLEKCVRLGYYYVVGGNVLLTCRRWDITDVSGQEVTPKHSYSQRNNAEERGSCLLRGGSVKWRILGSCLKSWSSVPP